MLRRLLIALKQKATPLNLAKLENLHLFQLVQESLTDWDKSGTPFTDRDDYPTLFAKCRQSLVAYKAGLDSDKSSKIDQELKKADKLRDADLSILRKQIRSFSGSQRPEKAEHYQTLKHLLDENKGIESLQFSKENAKINQLLERLETPKYTAAISGLGLTSFVNDLKESQAAFEKLYTDDKHAKSGQTVYNMKTLREQLVADYNLIIDYTEVMLAFRSENIFQKVFNSFNTNRKTFADSLKHKKKTVKTDGEKGKQEAPEELD